MPLSDAQKATLKTYIEGRSDLMALDHNQDGTAAIANILNQATNPAVHVWKNSLGPDAYTQCYAGTVFDDVPLDKQGQWNIWTGTGSRSIDPSNPETRAMIENVFAGGLANQAQTRTALLAASKRTATGFEAIFAVGTGSDADPATLPAGLPGTISGQQIYEIMQW